MAPEKTDVLSVLAEIPMVETSSDGEPDPKKPKAASSAHKDLDRSQIAMVDLITTKMSNIMDEKLMKQEKRNQKKFDYLQKQIGALANATQSGLEEMRTDQKDMKAEILAIQKAMKAERDDRCSSDDKGNDDKDKQAIVSGFNEGSDADKVIAVINEFPNEGTRRAKVVEVTTFSDPTCMQTRPQGLWHGKVDPHLTQRALEEVRRHFDSPPVDDQTRSDKIEIGPYDTHGKWHRGRSLSSFPALINFMEAAMRTCGDRERPRDATGSVSTRLNVTLRRCRPGQQIKPYTDKRCYGEVVWAAVLYRTESSPALRYERHRAPHAEFTVPEVCGSVHRIAGEARWYWRHGMDAPREEGEERISVSWRWSLCCSPDWRGWYCCHCGMPSPAAPPPAAC